MEQLDTTGKRLRYFCDTFFPSVTAFAHELGYQKPGSLYDYFNDRKKPGGQILDRFRMLGGDPNWLRYGTGSMFADNDTGRTLRMKYQSSVQYPPFDNRLPVEQTAGEPQPAYRTDHDATAAMGMEQTEALYVLISRILFRLKASRPAITPQVLHMYRDLLAGIQRELDAIDAEQDQQEQQKE